MPEESSWDGSGMDVGAEYDVGLEGRYGGSRIELNATRLDVRSQLDTGGVRIWHQEGSGITRMRWEAATWSLALHPAEDDHRLGVQWGKSLLLAAELSARDGGITARLDAGIRQVHWSLMLGWASAGRREFWNFSEPSGLNSLELAWSSLRDGKDVHLELRPTTSLTLRAGMAQERIGFGTWQGWGLGDSGHAANWNLGAGWDGSWGHWVWSGAWRNSRLVTQGWKNDDGERRIFHELGWRLDRHCQELEWSGRFGRARVGAEKMSAGWERPQDRREFLFWNALDGSTWAPLFTLLYTRSDFLEGAITGAHEWLELQPRFAWSGLVAKTTLVLDRLEADWEFRWRRREIRGFEMNSRKDTTGRQVDLWLLRPGLDLERRFGMRWTLGMGGTAAVPLWVSSKNRPGSGGRDSAEVGTGSSSASLSGGWAVSAWARFRL